MAITYNELLERLRDVEETELLELLNLTSDDLVSAFGDIIEERSDELFGKFESEQAEEQWLHDF